MSPVILYTPSVLNTNNDSLRGIILKIGSFLAPIGKLFISGAASGSLTLE